MNFLKFSSIFLMIHCTRLSTISSGAIPFIDMVEHCEVGAFAPILEDFFCAGSGASRIFGNEGYQMTNEGNQPKKKIDLNDVSPVYKLGKGDKLMPNDELLALVTRLGVRHTVE